MSANSLITVSSWLPFATGTLHAANIPTARLDALVLLADELGQDKAWVLAHPEHILQIEQVEKLSTKITQRAHHTPLAYIRGHAEFYGQEFMVNDHVLVPRPESESMIEILKQFVANDEAQTIIDVGTGSGCLAITAKLELPTTNVYAVDIDTNCLKVAEKNAQILHADIAVLEGDLLEPILTLPQSIVQPIILANLPYVPNRYPINQAAQHEPRLALFSGEDGLDHYRQLFAQLASPMIAPKAIITEALASQQNELVHLAGLHGYTLKDQSGLAQIFTRA